MTLACVSATTGVSTATNARTPADSVGLWALAPLAPESESARMATCCARKLIDSPRSGSWRRRRPRPTIRQYAVDRRRARSRQSESETRRHEHEFQLVVRETVLELDDEDRAEHVGRERESDRTGQEAEQERNCTEALEHGDERTGDAREWGAHLGERAGD